MFNPADPIKFTVFAACDSNLAVESLFVFDTVHKITRDLYLETKGTVIYLMDGFPIPMVDIRGQNSRNKGIEEGQALIIRDGQKLTALIVDDISEVVSVPYTSITEIANTNTERLKFFDGFFPYKNQRAIIINSSDIFRLGLPVPPHSNPRDQNDSKR